MPHRLLFLVLFPLLAGMSSPARAVENRSWRLEEFQVALEVLPDGTLDVTETLRPRFVGAYNGIIRTIPVDYRTPQGFDYKLFIKLLDVTDENGNKLRCETSHDGHYLKYKIWIAGARDTTKTAVLRYEVEDGIRYFDDHDELYWNATGTEWPVPIEHASAVVKLPPGAAGPSLRAVAYTGPFGSIASDADVEIQASTVSYRARRGLNYREGLTVVAGWPKGLVAKPGPVTRAWRFARANWMLGFPLAVLALMFSLWYVRRRDSNPRQAVAVMYEPPEKLTPGELGTLVDNRPDLRDITATLVDLAVRGYLRIEAKDEKRLFRTHREYVFHMLKGREQWTDLRGHERQLLDGIFRGGYEGNLSVKLSDLEHEFYGKLPHIRKALFHELVEGGYYRKSPEKVKRFYKGLGWLLFSLGMLAFMYWTLGVGTSPITAGLAGLLPGIIVLVFARIMPARTVRGARVRLQVLGFEEFLNRAEKDHLARLVQTPDMFEKYLPYAMALGVDRRWARAFEDIYKKAPDWYQGSYGDGFQPSLFVRDLNSFSERTVSALVSGPRSAGFQTGYGGAGTSSSEGSGVSSSSSSGFSSSGGSSGGGFGGGGGDAF